MIKDKRTNYEKIAERLLRRLSTQIDVLYYRKRQVLAEELEKIMTNTNDEHHGIFKDCVGMNLDT